MDNLSAEMIQCRKDGFGCHYGAWKATQKPAKPIPLQSDKNVVYCLNCGKIVIQRSRRPQKYCDAYCGMEYRSRRNRELRKKGVDNGKAENVRDE